MPSSHPLAQERFPGHLTVGVKEILKEHQLPTNFITDVFRQRSGIIVTVQSHYIADLFVRRRCSLKGTGFALFNVLSDREEQQRTALQPRFDEAVAEGKRAQFYRHRLKIDGKWV